MISRWRVGSLTENAVQRGRYRSRVFEHNLNWAQMSQTSLCPSASSRHLTQTLVLVFLPPGQFLLEQARGTEAAEMAQRAAQLESSEFDVVFSAAHMLRWAKPLGPVDSKVTPVPAS